MFGRLWQVLKDLKIKTIVDLRGRAKKNRTVRSEKHRLKDAAETAAVHVSKSSSCSS